MIINVNELASLFSDIGSWIGVLLIVLLILFYVIDGGQLSEQPPVTSATQSQQVNS